MTMRAPFRTPLLIIPFIPSVAFAQTIAQAAGLFNVFAGLMFMGAVLCFVGGLITYFVRLGTVEREDGIKIMEWGVATLFMLVVILAVVHVVQGNPAIVAIAFAAIIIGAILWIAINAAPSEKKEEKK